VPLVYARTRVGLFDYVKRRRERESAVSPADLAAYTDPVQPSREEPADVVGRPFRASGVQVNVGGNLDLGSLMGMVFEAMRTGSVQVSQAKRQTIDMSGTGLRDQILEALRAAGYDPEAGPQQIDATADPALQERVLGALTEHGIDLSAAGGMSIEAGDQRAGEGPGGGVPEGR